VATAKAGDGRSSGRFVKGASRWTSRVAGLSSVQLTDLRQKVPESMRIGVSPSVVIGLVYWPERDGGVQPGESRALDP
jgi:hypothetical protein